MSHADWLVLRATLLRLHSRGHLPWPCAFSAMFSTGHHLNYWSPL